MTGLKQPFGDSFLDEESDDEEAELFKPSGLTWKAATVSQDAFSSDGSPSKNGRTSPVAKAIVMSPVEFEERGTKVR